MVSKIEINRELCKYLRSFSEVDYWSSHDAMHHAEEFLSPRQWMTYIEYLRDIVPLDRPKGIQHAEAYEKAQAMVKTLREYKDTL